MIQILSLSFAKNNFSRHCMLVELAQPVDSYVLSVYIVIVQTYDHFRDVYKLYHNGEKVDSGSFAGDNDVAPIRPGGVFVIGQDQVNDYHSYVV